MITKSSGTKAVPDQEYILLPLLTSDPSLSKSLKDSPDVGFKPSREEEKMDSEHLENKDSEVSNTEEPRVHQEQDVNVNNTTPLNTVLYPTIVYSNDDKEVGAEADMNNLATNVPDKDENPVSAGKTHKENGIFISQEKYVADILKKFDFATVKTVSTPMETNKALLKDKEVADVDVHLYRSMIRSLMYLTASRPDIMFAICACTRFQVTPKTSHLHVIKRIFRYLKGHAKLGLWYPRDLPFDLEAFSSSDYVGASLDRKSTTGAEYVATANCCGQVLWIQNQLLDYGYKFMNTKIFIDNESTICIVKNPVFHSKTKHIEIRHHFIKDSYEKRLIQVNKIHTDHNVADLFTKAFAISIFQYLIANKTVIKVWEDRMERAATTASSLEAEQDSGNINRTQSMTTLNESFPQGTNSVYAARHSLTVVRHELMLPGITSYCWATAKSNIINGERQIQALVDKKKVIITEKSVRSDLMLEDAKGTKCLPNDVIFEQLTLTGMKNLEGMVKFLMYPRFVQVFLDKQVEGMSKHEGIYVIPSHTKKIFANMKRERKSFSRRITPLFQTMMVQAPEDMGKDSAAPTDSHSTPIITQPSSSKPQKKKSKRKQRKDSGPTEPIPDEATNEEPISTPSCDPPQSGEDRLQLTKLMSLCTKLQKQVLDLEEAKTAQAKEIASLKKRVKQLEKRKKLRTSGLKRLRKVGSASRVESSNDVSLGDQEDASKQGRKIADLDANAEVTLIDETQERYDEEMLFDVQDDLQGEVVAEKKVSAANPVTTAGEVVTIATATTTIDELTLAQTLMEIKAAKAKAVTTVAIRISTVVASIRPNAKGIIFHDQEKQVSAIVSSSQLPQPKDKGNRKMVEPEKPLKKKIKLHLIKNWHSDCMLKNKQSWKKKEADEQLAARLQAEEQEQFSIEEKSRMLVEMIAERKKFFTA
ncbi:hypothetical protein Tco_0995090 [Tanacetum coccineum]